MDNKDLLNMYFNSIDSQRQLLKQLQQAVRQIAILNARSDKEQIKTDSDDPWLSSQHYRDWKKNIMEKYE